MRLVQSHEKNETPGVLAPRGTSEGLCNPKELTRLVNLRTILQGLLSDVLNRLCRQQAVGGEKRSLNR